MAADVHANMDANANARGIADLFLYFYIMSNLKEMQIGHQNLNNETLAKLIQASKQ